jgi:hypothetical protein
MPNTCELHGFIGYYGETCKQCEAEKMNVSTADRIAAIRELLYEERLGCDLVNSLARSEITNEAIQKQVRQFYGEHTSRIRALGRELEKIAGVDLPPLS